MVRVKAIKCVLTIVCILSGALLAACGSDPAGPSATGGGSASANWRWLNPLPTGNPIEDMAFRSDQEGLAVGYHGVILATTNGGADWSVSYVGNATLQDIAYAPDGSRYVAGRFTLLHSSNGTSWSVRSVPADLRAIAAGDGYLVALGERSVYVTTNGGETFDDPMSSVSRLSDVAVRGALCLAVNTAGEILRSRDRGLTWDTPRAADNVPLNAVQIVSDTRAFACGRNASVLMTDDAGDTWEPVATGFSMDFESVAFVTPSVGYLGGHEMDQSGLIRTDNGGQTWSAVNAPAADGGIRNISARSASTLYIQTYDGLYRTDNGGGSWTPITRAATQRPLEDVALLENNTIVACHSSGIVRSHDRGRTWQSYPAGDGYSVNGVAFHDSQVGAVVGHPGQVWFTSDGGASWDQRGPGGQNTLYKVHFFSNNEVMVVGAGDDDIWYTDNAGTSWSKRPSPNTGNLIGMHVRDDQRIVVSGHNHNVSVTSNRGVWWSAPNLSAAQVSVLEDCAWRGDVVIAAGRGAGAVVVRSANNGANWSVSNLVGAGTTALAVAFRSDSEVFLSTGDGQIFRSEDAGVTWNEETLPMNITGYIEAIAFFDDGTGIFVGSNGTVLAH